MPPRNFSKCAHILVSRGSMYCSCASSTCIFASLDRALEINPSCSLAYGSIGTALAWAGQTDASIERNGYALRINPQDPANFFRHFGLALAHYLAGR